MPCTHCLFMRRRVQQVMRRTGIENPLGIRSENLQYYHLNHKKNFGNFSQAADQGVSSPTNRTMKVQHGSFIRLKKCSYADNFPCTIKMHPVRNRRYGVSNRTSHNLTRPESSEKKYYRRLE